MKKELIAFVIGMVIGAGLFKWWYSWYSDLMRTITKSNKDASEDYCPCGEELVDGRCPLEPVAMGDNHE